MKNELDYRFTMNEPYDTVRRDGVAKKGNTILGFVPRSVEFHLGK